MQGFPRCSPRTQRSVSRTLPWEPERPGLLLPRLRGFLESQLPPYGAEAKPCSSHRIVLMSKLDHSCKNSFEASEVLYKCETLTILLAAFCS